MARNNDKYFRATIAPGVKPANFNIDDDITDFHYSFGHVHEGLMREPAKQKNVNLISTLQECQWDAIAKGCAKPISTLTGTRAAKLGGRDLLDFCGENSVQTIGGRKYMLIIRDGFTRFIAVCFIRSEDEVSIYFKRYLANYYFAAVPCPVEIVRTDDAAEFKSLSFANLSREQGNMQKTTTADSPQVNGVAERGIVMIEPAGKTAIIQSGVSIPGMGVPSGNSACAAQAYWVCHALNAKAITSNPRRMTVRYVLW